jgi:hypothetical protein
VTASLVGAAPKAIKRPFPSDDATGRALLGLGTAAAAAAPWPDLRDRALMPLGEAADFRFEHPTLEQASARTAGAGTRRADRSSKCHQHPAANGTGPPAKMSPFEETGRPRPGGRFGIPSKPGCDGEQSAGVVGAVAAFQPWTVQLGMFEDPHRIGQSGQVTEGRQWRHRLDHATALAGKTSAMSER